MLDSTLPEGMSVELACGMVDDPKIFPYIEQNIRQVADMADHCYLHAHARLHKSPNEP